MINIGVPRHSQGFTLLEMLVVMLLTALTSVIVMQGVAHALLLRDRVLEHTEHQREDALRRAWFKDAVGGLVADPAQVEHHLFSGRPREFSGLTLAAVSEPAGTPVLVRWWVEREDDVIHLYIEERDRLVGRVWSWRADLVEFSYYDPDSGWSDYWPPRGQEQRSPALPALIMMRTVWHGQPRAWIASVRGARTPRLDARPLDELL